MLGVVLLSEYNELIHAFGNSLFREHFFNNGGGGRSYSEGRGQLSSSSGVSSSASSSTAASSHLSCGQHSAGISRGDGAPATTSITRKSTRKENRTTPTTTARTTSRQIGERDEEDDGSGNKTETDFMEDDEQPFFQESLLLQQLMPLVALCRTREQQSTDMAPDSGHQIECIQSGSTLQVRIGALPFSNLLMLVNDQNLFPVGISTTDALFHSLFRCLDFHYGPQLQLIPAASPLAQQLQRRCEHRMLALLTQAEEAATNMDVKKKEGSREDENDANEEDQQSKSQHHPFCQDIAFANVHPFIQARLMPSLRELSLLMSRQLGRRCRCLFLYSGRLLASVNSHPPAESSLSSLDPDQLLSIVQFALQPHPPVDEDRKIDAEERGGVHTRRSGLLKCQTEQSWLQSRTLRRRQLHNLFVLSLNERVDVLVLATAEHANLTGTVADCLELLDLLGANYFSPDQQQLADFVAKTQKQLDGGHRMLAALDQRSLDRARWELFDRGGDAHLQWDCLANVHRTGALMQQLWSRFKFALETFMHQNRPSASSTAVPGCLPIFSASTAASSSSSLANSRRLMMSASSQSLLTMNDDDDEPYNNNNDSTVSSVYSNLEWSTFSSAAVPTFSSGARLLTAHLDAMRAQLKKVLRCLLTELLACSSGLARSRSLPALKATIRQQMGHQLAEVFAELERQIDQQWAHGNPGRPAALAGLDMVAYRFTRAEGTPLHFQYAGDEHNEELFRHICDAFPANELVASADGEEMTIARTGDGQLILQLRAHCCPIPPPPLEQSQRKHTNKLASSFKQLPLIGGLASKWRGNGQGQSSNSGNQDRNGQTGAGQQFHAVIQFSRHVHLGLALKQAQRLMEVLAGHMQRCQRNFQ